MRCTVPLILSLLAISAQAITPLPPDETVTGSLASGDLWSPALGLHDEFTVERQMGQILVIAASSEAVDLVLELHSAGGRRWINDDAHPGTVNPRLEVTLPEPGPLLLRVRPFLPQETGDYTLRLTAD
ncbi:hypothetical protein JXA47_04920 [Candidatus Sumerlaeota bacterium]|nr:hypothetical protein [Candidatus Sumerlaeota bacterium]